VIATINPILRGWVNYFRVGHSSICVGVVKRWVEEKVRRHLMRAHGRQGFGWTRWSSEWLYDRLGLYNDYQLIRWSGAKVALVGMATGISCPPAKPGREEAPGAWRVLLLPI
jgi:RNA-directed DNA polymerase